MVGGQLPLPMSCVCPPPPPRGVAGLSRDGACSVRAASSSRLPAGTAECVSPCHRVAVGAVSAPPRARTPSEMTFCVSAAAAPVRMQEERLPGQAPTAGMRPEEEED